jgi:hypothetical protein
MVLRFAIVEWSPRASDHVSRASTIGGVSWLMIAVIS